MPSLERYIEITLIIGILLSIIPNFYIIKWILKGENKVLRYSGIIFLPLIIGILNILLIGYILHFWF